MARANPPLTGLSAAAAGPGTLVLRRSTLATLVLLIVQYCVGMDVNLYASVPAGAKGLGVGGAIGKALADGAPSLVVHVVLGLLLILAALNLVVRTALLRRWTGVVASVVGLVALVGAAFQGASYVSTPANSASLAMALLTAIALLAYVVILYGAPAGPPTT